MFGSILGFVPCFGLLTDEGRKASWIVEINTTKKPEAQLLGSAIGMKVMEDVPYIKGLDGWIGTELNDDACAYLKDFGAATASNGAVGLYHIDRLTPEAVEQGENLIKPDAKVYVIDDAELERVKASYPVIWKDKDATPRLCFMGCPHMTFSQLNDWTEKLEAKLKEKGRRKVAIKTVFTSAPGVIKEFEKTENYKKLKDMGVVVSYICPLMYMNNPMCAKMPVITNSNKLRTYTTSRYYSDSEILDQITRRCKIMERIFKGRVVVPGEVTLKALVSHGGFNTLASFKDCKEGKNTCTDQNNPDLYGKSTVGVALCLPQTIGSTTGGMVLYNSAVIGCNPGALLFSNTIDSLAAAGAILASVWTPNNIPTVDELGQEFLDHVKDGMTIEIRANGEVLVTD